MSGSALLELTADSNALLGTSHNLSHLGRLHSIKAQQHTSRQRHQSLNAAQQRLHAADRSAKAALLHHAGLHADIAAHSDALSRRGEWTASDRLALRSLPPRSPAPQPLSHQRRRDDSEEEEEADHDEGEECGAPSSAFDALYELAQRMQRPVWEVVEHQLRQRSPVPLSVPSPPPSSLSSAEADAFSRHIAQQFEASYHPPPPPLLPPSLPAVKRRSGDSRDGRGQHRSRLLSAIFADSGEEIVDNSEEDSEEDEEYEEEEGEEAEEDGGKEDVEAAGSESDESIALSQRLQRKRTKSS